MIFTSPHTRRRYSPHTGGAAVRAAVTLPDGWNPQEASYPADGIPAGIPAVQAAHNTGVVAVVVG